VTEPRLWFVRRILLLTPFALSGILVLLGPLRAMLTGDPDVAPDFHVFYAGADLFEQGRFGELWDQAAFAGVTGLDEPFLWYAYPPFYARASVPMTALTIEQASVLWTLAGAALLPLTIRVVAGRWDWWLSLLAFISLPAAANFQLGQNAAVAALIVGVSFALVAKGRHVPGGIVLGVLVFKPQLAIGVALWWLVDRRYRAAALSALATASLLVATSVALDPTAWRSYWSVLPDLANVRGQPIQVSIVGFMDLALPNWSPARAAGMVLAVVVLAVFGWWVARGERSPDLAFSIAVAVTLLSAPYVIIYDYLILLAPIVVLLRSRDLDEVWLPGVVLSWSVLFTYVIRELADDWVGMQVQLAPVALGLTVVALVHHFGHSARTPHPS
jgi:hypothetical protein